MVEMSAQLSLNDKEMANVLTSVQTNKEIGKTNLDCSVASSMIETIIKMAYDNPSSRIISQMSTVLSESNIDCNDVLKDSMETFAKARLMVQNSLKAIEENLLGKLIFS